MMNLFQEVSPIDLNRAWDINPYNGLGYGAVVLILGYIAYYFKNQVEKERAEVQKERAEVQKKQEYIDIIIGKIHELGDTMTDKMQDISHHAQNTNLALNDQKSQNDKVIYILEDVKHRLEKIEKNE